MACKVTVDAGLLRQNVLLPAVQTLKDWEAKGQIELFESDRAKVPSGGWPGGTSSTTFKSRQRTARKPASKGLSFQQLSGILFPNRDPSRLNMGETNSVAHLMMHHTLGRSIFVTNNVQVFMSDGKQSRLRTMYKILVFTPDEAVTVLRGAGEVEGIEPVVVETKPASKRG